MATKQRPSKKSPSKNRGSRKGPPIGDGSPITVGGGGGLDRHRRALEGVWCKFRHDADHYPDPRPGWQGKKKFKNNIWSVKLLKLKLNGQPYDFSQHLPENGDCTIDISCARRDDDLQIKGKKPLSIEFDTRKYAQQVGTDPNAHAYDTYADTLTIEAGDFYFQTPIGDGVIWELEVDYTPTRRGSTRSRRRH